MVVSCQDTKRSREKRKKTEETKRRCWPITPQTLSLQARVDLRHVVVVGVVPPVAAGLGDRGRDVELGHLSGLLEDVDVHALGSVPCDVAVESWNAMLVSIVC
jgi:hypothetical protein